MKNFIFGILVLFATVFMPINALAEEQDKGDYKVSREVVEKTMANLVNLMKNVEVPDDADEKRQLIREVIEKNLDPAVDFKRIVKRIMGKHFAGASKQQRNDFLDAFRNSLVNIYGQYLLSSDLKSIASKLKYKVLPLGKQRRKGVASVNCVISFDGSQYDIAFSMYYNPRHKKWLMENIIVEGINLGINYRTQFDRLMVSYQGDYDKVIGEWSTVDA